MSNIAFQYVPQTGTTGYGAANADNGYVSTDSAITGSASFSYDGNQNMTFDGVNTLTYDVENRLTQAVNPALGTSTYLYDPLGHRKQKQVSSPGYVITTQFVLAGGQEIADYSGTGAGAAILLTVRGAGGLPVAAVTPAVDGAALTAVYYHHDVMGSTVAATEPGESGAAMVFTYSDFGVPGAGSGLSYTYAGYRYDTETGLYYVNARYYNPNLGRFLQTDPIGLQGGTNLYAYVGNDPINLIDPSGHCSQWSSQSPDMSIFGNSTPNVVLAPGANIASGISVQQTPMQTLNGQPLQFPNQGAPGTYPNTGNLYGYGIGVAYTAVNTYGYPVTSTGMTLSESVVLTSSTPQEAANFVTMDTAPSAVSQWPNGQFYDGIMNASQNSNYPSSLANMPNFTIVDTQTLTLTQPGGPNVTSTNIITTTNNSVSFSPQGKNP